ncbi:MAG TPA: hypothetical protein PLG99_08810, partial [Kaistiaceae bacterium]|nr:hypothetical protein [Kaistiaceae bacterium]
DYRQIQAAINAGDIHRDGDGDLVVLTQYRGKWWQAVLRRTATGEEIFLKSFRPLRDRQLEAIRDLPRLK